MKTLIRGEKIKLGDYSDKKALRVDVSIQSAFEIDITCFGLSANKMLVDDRYMVFYNQHASPVNEIKLNETANGRGVFDVQLDKLPNDIPYIVFTATIDGDGTMGQIDKGAITFYVEDIPFAEYTFTNADFKQEKAIIIAELYMKDIWRIAAIGQGFDGGLAALLKSFGGQAAEEEAIVSDVVQQQPESKRIQLEKRLEKEAPQLLDLSKKARITLEKVGLADHTAKVALCLDISGSMARLYSSGKIQAFAERILALSTRFDDDGSIDMFLFGQQAHHAGELTIRNFNGFVEQVIKQHPLEGGTYYAKVMSMIRAYYFGEVHMDRQVRPQQTPIYVMFVTDGDTFDRPQTVKHMQDSSYEPIFWQFMAIGETKKDAGKGGFLRNIFKSDFSFLEELDELQGRFIDNADFFSVVDPAEIADDALYDLLMQEYPAWVQLAKANGLIR